MRVCLASLQQFLLLLTLFQFTFCGAFSALSLLSEVQAKPKLSSVAKKKTAKTQTAKQKSKKKSRPSRHKKTRKQVKAKRQSYYVTKGETWSSIATILKVSVKKLKRWNKKLRRRKTLKPGQRLFFYGPLRKTEAIGRANHGSLKNAIHLDPDGDGLGKGYAMSRQRPDLWGTPELIKLIKTCGRTYRRYFSKKYAPIPIGDLSSRFGGPLKEHKSHQNGRDVDVGFMRKKPLSKGYFKDTPPKEMNLYAQWVVLKCFLDDSKTQMVFIERSRVKALKKYIKRIYKKRPAKLKKYLAFFQGKKRAIRPDSVHKSHMHVRIHCPKDDRRCIN